MWEGFFNMSPLLYGFWEEEGLMGFAFAQRVPFFGGRITAKGRNFKAFFVSNPHNGELF